METKEKIKVTHLGDCWSVRYWTESGKLFYQEARCELQCDIGWSCRELLRWANKLGFVTPLTSSARKRHLRGPVPEGKVWTYVR